MNAAGVGGGWMLARCGRLVRVRGPARRPAAAAAPGGARTLVCVRAPLDRGDERLCEAGPAAVAVEIVDRGDRGAGGGADLGLWRREAGGQRLADARLVGLWQLRRRKRGRELGERGGGWGGGLARLLRLTQRGRCDRGWRPRARAGGLASASPTRAQLFEIRPRAPAAARSRARPPASACCTCSSAGRAPAGAAAPAGRPRATPAPAVAQSRAARRPPAARARRPGAPRGRCHRGWPTAAARAATDPLLSLRPKERALKRAMCRSHCYRKGRHRAVVTRVKVYKTWHKAHSPILCIELFAPVITARAHTIQ